MIEFDENKSLAAKVRVIGIGEVATMPSIR